ncbi:DUF692 family multinuclear iron-containing protein [Olleya sp. HaHaR_3_96]|uniref:multinuclear nonheme iron-dependent oxidase n=1 Tax=Olleya sp. HaHaR_3_96 TaxID=2745560 RepID=UPI001C500CC7|nr:DUF692 family multinuclear iron-containing protein [Olleya sp. HaHaR_3_96]QXP61577.1 DUF692 family protein [Olleya sp. HaHaR_3_96]
MKKNKPKLGLSIMPNPEFIAAALPLFESAQVEVIEWSFDTILDKKYQPEWLPLVLKEYGDNNRLLGHGVYYAPLDANWGPNQDNWLQKAKLETLAYNYNHLSEHFGVMSSANAHHGFPLPFDLSDTILKIGIDRLKRLQNTVQLDIGIENLALASNVSDILKQGAFIEKLVAPINGFVILDLHNIYCQSINFDLDLLTIITSYPLHLVKEIHLSGGSWDHAPNLTKPIRRDTHDGRIPEVLLDLLPEVLQRCPVLEFVIFERLGDTFQNENDGLEFRADFNKIQAIIDHTAFSSNARQWTLKKHDLGPPLIDLPLLNKQQELREHIRLETANNHPEWNTNMWITATKLYKKWNT